MTTGITAVGTAPSSAWPRRLAVVVLVAIATFAVTRFVTFSPSSPSASRTVTRPAPRDTGAQIAALEASTKGDPADARGWQRLGQAYLRQAIATFDPSFYDLSRRALDRAAALDPGDSTTTVTRGALLLSLHEFGRARDLVLPVTRKDPFDADALTVLVDAQVELGAYADAATTLQALLDLRPGLPAYSRASYLRELHGDVAGAQRSMREALTAGAGDAFDNATVTTFLGDLAFNAGDVDAAAARYRDARRLDSRHVNATLGSARVLAARGDEAGAIRLLDRLTRRVPLPAAVILLGDLQAATGATAAANSTFELVRSIEELQRTAGAVTDLESAIFAADHGDPAGALPAARAADAARPDNVYAADALAWALVRSGDAAAAQPLIERALRLGSVDASVRYHAAVIADALGDRERARRELATVANRNPWFSFSQRADAGALAQRLGMPVPPAWTVGL